ncbi:hypothetical protein [Methylovulum psychrotolerans]|uniref:hypothetical protein n=1 Tax=Methylovulum psychrotolerans TaxID=1704499 RepID=UPI000CDF1F1F|nr:hypothetical protein [Methylovulum psychrotolerans]
MDFVVGQVDSVVWLDSTDTLTGRRYPEYYCYQDQPVDRPHQFGASLPRRVALKRYGLLGR